jgi:hypothetical protein
MKRIGLVVMTAFLFASCMPAATTALNIFSGDNLKGRLGLKIAGDAATVTFEAGDQEVQGMALFIGGEPIRFETAEGGNCKPVKEGFGCTLEKLAAKSSFVAKVKGGKFSASVTYYRPGSDRPYALLAEVR